MQDCSPGRKENCKNYKKTLPPPMSCEQQFTHDQSYPINALLCVYRNNNPYLGHFFGKSKSSNNVRTFRASVKALNLRKEIIPENILQRKSLKEGYYSEADILLTFERRGIVTNKPMMIPQPWLDLHCTEQTVKYLKESSYKCAMPLSEEKCQTNKNFNVYSYLLQNSNEIPYLRSEKLPYIVSNFSASGALSRLTANINDKYSNNIFQQLRISSQEYFRPGAEVALFNWYKKLSHLRPLPGSFQPTFDPNYNICHNVVTGVRFVFTWRGKSIMGLDIDIERASVPVSLPDDLFEEVFDGRRFSRTKREKAKISLLSHFEIKYIHENNAQKQNSINTIFNATDINASTNLYDVASKDNDYDIQFLNEDYSEHFTLFSNYTDRNISNPENASQTNQTLYFTFNETDLLPTTETTEEDPTTTESSIKGEEETDDNDKECDDQVKPAKRKGYVDGSSIVFFYNSR